MISVRIGELVALQNNTLFRGPVTDIDTDETFIKWQCGPNEATSHYTDLIKLVPIYGRTWEVPVFKADLRADSTYFDRVYANDPHFPIAWEEGYRYAQTHRDTDASVVDEHSDYFAAKHSHYLSDDAWESRWMTYRYGFFLAFKEVTGRDLDEETSQK